MPSISIFCSPTATRSTESGSSSRLASPTETRTRSNILFSPGWAARGWCRAVLTTPFGVAFARTQVSGAFLPFLRQQLNLGLQKEDALEMYYNIAVTPWLNVTADLQVVNPALKRATNEVGQLARVDTAVIAGARTRIRF